MDVAQVKLPLPTGTYALINRAVELAVKPEYDLVYSNIICKKNDYSDSFKWILDHGLQWRYTIKNKLDGLYAYCGTWQKPPKDVIVLDTNQWYFIKPVDGVDETYTISTVDSGAFLGLSSAEPGARVVLGTVATSHLFQWHVVSPRRNVHGASSEEHNTPEAMDDVPAHSESSTDIAA